MRLENSFEVTVPPARAWQLLMDVPRVVPCMPGAQLIETLDDSHWKARMLVKLGPVSLTFDADVARKDVDETRGRVTLAVRARELRGRGGAGATIESSLEPIGSGTRVSVLSDVQLSGAAAQFGGPVVKDVAAQLTREFVSCLERQLSEAPAEPRRAKPVSALRLLARALLARLRRR